MIQNYVEATLPSLNRGGALMWQATSCWTPEYFAETAPSVPVGLIASDTGIIRWREDGTPLHPEGQKHLSQVPLLNAIDWIKESRSGGKKYYILQQNLLEKFPQLLPEITPIVPFDKATTNIWISSEGCTTPLHFDYVDNHFAQIYGEKTFAVFAPSSTGRLYKNPDNVKMSHLSRVNLADPDFDLHPDARSLKPIYFQLKPGDVLFLPKFWWHFVVSTTESISVSQWVKGEGI